MSIARSPYRLALALALAPSLLVGCAKTDPGSALIKYRIGNDKTCEEAGVNEIRVVLDEADGIEDSAPCGDGEFLFTGIPIGKYNVQVQGIDSNGVAIVDNIDDTVVKINIEGDGAQKETPILVLGDAPARLRVRWNFGFASCESTGIDSFLIEGFDMGGSNVLLREELDCSTPGEGSDGYRLVPDPDRELDGRDFSEAGVRAQDSDGNMIGLAALFTFEPPSPGYAVDLTVNCDEAGCTGSNSPD